MTPQQIERMRQQNRTNDFEIGGLYTINNVSDNLQLVRGSYTKTINASTMCRDSQLLLDKLRDEANNKVLFPANKIYVDIEDYVLKNFDKVSAAVATTAKKAKNRGRL